MAIDSQKFDNKIKIDFKIEIKRMNGEKKNNNNNNSRSIAFNVIWIIDHRTRTVKIELLIFIIEILCL